MCSGKPPSRSRSLSCRHRRDPHVTHNILSRHPCQPRLSFNIHSSIHRGKVDFRNSPAAEVHLQQPALRRTYDVADSPRPHATSRAHGAAREVGDGMVGHVNCVGVSLYPTALTPHFLDPQALCGVRRTNAKGPGATALAGRSSLHAPRGDRMLSTLWMRATPRGAQGAGGTGLPTPEAAWRQ